jgi:farnesyl diphosphate synthase
MSASEAKAARRTKFEAVFGKIRDELLEHFAGEKMPAEAVEWYRNVSANILGRCGARWFNGMRRT